MMSFEEFSDCMRDSNKKLDIEWNKTQETKKQVLSNIEERHKALEELLTSIEERES